MIFVSSQNLKTYSRHSGGKVSADLVTEVLKDSDVPPSIGAGRESSWDEIEYDGTYFFPHVNVFFFFQSKVYLLIRPAPFSGWNSWFTRWIFTGNFHQPMWPHRAGGQLVGRKTFSRRFKSIRQDFAGCHFHGRRNCPSIWMPYGADQPVHGLHYSSDRNEMPTIAGRSVFGGNVVAHSAYPFVGGGKCACTRGRQQRSIV